ncbi:phospholipase D family protein [Marinobacter sp. F3R11]|uniref:phospholipase D family protein n=1 Tax=Marinobacter sp. F3R11 TaxID=2267231 RepID=UPI000DE8B642|nr:phospholipase D family protein [Marinobacter sp. F3R11]RBW52075.1 phospholipase D family protein [Marinobacter sp. F3R11]
MSNWFRRHCPRPISILVLVLVISGCALPPVAERTESWSVPAGQTANTRLGSAIAPLAGAHPGESGVIMLENPYDAFAARALLAEGAETTLDVQYYIWQYDITGTMLLDALYRAAERGVRVRLLLDDNGISGLDKPLAAMDTHPNIEVRLFNPFVVRNPKWIGYLTSFPRLNHRMHNKSFIADNQAAIIGGRNIADAYFGAGQGALFADLDVLAIGPVVHELSDDFDRYWSSASAYPATTILPAADQDDLALIVDTARQCSLSSEASKYICVVAESRLLKGLLEGNLEFTWAPVTMVSDDPAKVLGEKSENGLLSRQLAEVMGSPERSVTLVSPYFIPTQAGVDIFRDMESRGVQVRVLTNSLEANDVAMVHAGYAKYRKPLLEAGVQLFEMRELSGGVPVESQLQNNLMGSSASSLHAKTFAVDNERLFVGSFNFDPRSVHINTELGFVIESPELTQMMNARFDEQTRVIAYELVLDEGGDLQWLERNGEEVIRYNHDPGTGLIKRMMVAFFSFLPIESLL